MTAAADEALVARLLAVIDGQAPMTDAPRLLTPDVTCHMDSYTVQGVDVWCDWLEFIRSRSTERLRVHVERYVTNADGTITAFGCLRRASEVLATPCQGEARYRIENGRIAEIWTSRGNYEIIFGAKVRHPLTWLLVLLELAVWRRLPWRRGARTSHPRPAAGDRTRNELRHRGEADDHLERRHPD